MTPTEIHRAQWASYMGKFFLSPGFPQEARAVLSSRFLSEAPVQLHLIFSSEDEYLRFTAALLLLRFPQKIMYKEADVSLVSDQYFERGGLDYLALPDLVLLPHSRFLRANSATLPALGSVFDRRLGVSLYGLPPVTIYASFSTGYSLVLPGIESLSCSDLLAGRSGAISAPVSLGEWGSPALSGLPVSPSGAPPAPALAGSLPVPPPRL